MVHIQLKTLKPLQFDSKYDILISVSLFTMKESYRNFSEYVTSFLNWLPHIPRNAYVRMYVDSSALQMEDFKKIMNLKTNKLEIIQYYCKEFFNEENLEISFPKFSKSPKISSKISKSIQFKENVTFPSGFHDGTFGSIIRLIPLFEKPPGIKYIWISDTDLHIKVFSYRSIKEMQNVNAKVFYFSRGCYNKPWSEGIRYPIIAFKIIMSSKVELNKGLLTRFLNDILKGKYHDIFESIKKRLQEEGNRSFENIKYFPYGFDELFTNKYLYPIFTQYKRLIAFEIGLGQFLKQKIIDLPGKKKQFTNVSFKSWAVKMKQDEFKFLVDTTEEIYEKIKDIDFTKLENKNAKMLETCKRDYEDHRKYIDLASFDGGINAMLVKKPYEE